MTNAHQIFLPDHCCSKISKNTISIYIILKNLPNGFIKKDIRKIFLQCHSFFQRNIPNQPFSLFTDVCLNSVKVKFQMFTARQKANGTILVRSFMYFHTLGRINNY